MASRFWVGGTGTWDAADTTHWASSSGGAGGQTVPGSGDAVTFDASSGGGTVTVNTTINSTSITMGAFTGTLDFAANDNNVTLQTFSGSGTGTRTLNMGDGTWTITGNVGVTFGISTTTNLTFSANASTLKLQPSGATAQMFWASGGLTYNIVTIAGTWNGQNSNFSGSPTIATFNITVACALFLTSGTTTTITNAFTWAGTSSAPFMLFSAGTATIAAASGSTMTWAALGAITFSGTAVNATNSLNIGGNNMNGGSITAPSAGGGGVIGG